MRNLKPVPSSRDVVLVVDDDPKIADLVRLYLERAGFQVVVAADGLAALQLMRKTQPALMVLDLMLPGVDGSTVARIAREEPSIPIVMLTALRSTRHPVPGLEAGAAASMASP